ncbi:hypothetical protein D3C76_398770 [compost metagenome]
MILTTDLVSDKAHTSRADRIVEDVGLVFHYDIDRNVVEEAGEPIPPLGLISLLPLPPPATVLCGFSVLWNYDGD